MIQRKRWRRDQDAALLKFLLLPSLLFHFLVKPNSQLAEIIRFSERTLGTISNRWVNLQFSICFSLNLSHESWCFAKNFSVLRTALLHWNLISGLIWNLLSSVFAFCEFWFLLLNLKFLFLILFFLLKSIFDIIHISCFLFKERCELTCTLFVLNFEISLIILFSYFRGPYWICTSLFLAKLPV